MISCRMLAVCLGLFTWTSQAAALAAGAGLVVNTAANPGFANENITLWATVTSETAGYVPTGTVSFKNDNVAIPGCGAAPLQPAAAGKARASCQHAGFTFGTHQVDAQYGGDAFTAAKSGALSLRIVQPTPGIAFINSNTTGPLTVTGATLNVGTITNFSADSVIQLGPNPGGELFLQMDRLTLGPGVNHKYRASAVNQVVRLLVDKNLGPVSIAGVLRGEAGTFSPIVILEAPAGLNVHDVGKIEVPNALSVDLWDGAYYSRGNLQNEGVIDGGEKFEAFAAFINGAGSFQALDHVWSFYGNGNNPVDPDVLKNYLSLVNSTIAPPPAPTRIGPDGAAISPFRVTLNADGPAPQFINLKLNGDASIWMPSAWPAGSGLLPNNPVVPPGGTRPAGVPEPAYGGGSMIVRATGNLTLYDGGPTGTKDLVFPGAMVFIADGTLNFGGVTVNQGWTSQGRAFQGLFFESNNIDSTGPINLYSNDLNWSNFSTLPNKTVTVLRLTQQPNGSSSYVNADALAPHLNTYSVIAAAAGSGACWVCLINPNPVDMNGP